MRRAASRLYSRHLDGLDLDPAGASLGPGTGAIDCLLARAPRARVPAALSG